MRREGRRADGRKEWVRGNEEAACSMDYWRPGRDERQGDAKIDE